MMIAPVATGEGQENVDDEGEAGGAGRRTNGTRDRDGLSQAKIELDGGRLNKGLSGVYGGLLFKNGARRICQLLPRVELLAPLTDFPFFRGLSSPVDCSFGRAPSVEIGGWSI